MDAVAGVENPVHLEVTGSSRVPPVDYVVVAEESGAVSGRALAAAAAVLERHPCVGIVFVCAEEHAGGVQRGHRWLRNAAAHGPDAVGGRGAVVRRSTFNEAGPHRPGTRNGALSLWLRAAALGDVAHVAEPLPTASVVGLSRSPAPRVGEITELHERAHAFLELFGGFAPLRGHARLRSAAYRALARSARRRALVAAYEGDRVEASLCLHLAHDVTSWRRER